MSLSYRYQKFEQEIEVLHYLYEGPITRSVIDIIGGPTLRFVIRTYRLMTGLPPGLKDEEIRRSLLKIGTECRKVLGRSIEPEEIHEKWARLLSTKKEQTPANIILSEQDDKQYTAVELFETIIINEANDMLNLFAPEELSRVYLRIKSSPSNRPTDYTAHYLIYSLNFFLKQSRPNLSTSSIISAFIKEQKITEAGGKAEAKNVQERYLDKHDSVFVSGLKEYYDRSLALTALQRAVKKNDQAQYIFDEKAQHVTRLISDDLPSESQQTKISQVIFFFPSWDAIFSKTV